MTKNKPTLSAPQSTKPLEKRFPFHNQKPFFNRGPRPTNTAFRTQNRGGK